MSFYSHGGHVMLGGDLLKYGVNRADVGACSNPVPAKLITKMEMGWGRSREG